MRLQLVKQGDFLGTKCDFYVNETGDIFMSRTQIGYALKYKNPSKGIEDIHNRHHDRLDTMSVKVDPLSLQGSNPHYRNGERAYMYPEKGIYEICRYSRQKVAGIFMIGFMMLFSPSKRTVTTSLPRKTRSGWESVRRPKRYARPRRIRSSYSWNMQGHREASMQTGIMCH